jgi:hypothetical protein
MVFDIDDGTAQAVGVSRDASSGPRSAQSVFT